jgi:arsenate reductase-like glutaredoxin family protein
MRDNALLALKKTDERERYNALFEVLIGDNPDKQDLREFNKGYTKARLESLIYKTKKKYQIKDLDVINEKVEKTAKAVSTDKNLKVETPEAKSENIVTVDDSEPIRKEFPFLNDENCPEVLLIAVGRKIAAYNKEKEINEKIIELNETNPESDELKELAEKAIHYFNENEKLYKELKHYGETGEILGEHEIFV